MKKVSWALDKRCTKKYFFIFSKEVRFLPSDNFRVFAISFDAMYTSFRRQSFGFPEPQFKWWARIRFRMGLVGGGVAGSALRLTISTSHVKSGGIFGVYVKPWVKSGLADQNWYFFEELPRAWQNIGPSTAVAPNLKFHAKPLHDPKFPADSKSTLYSTGLVLLARKKTSDRTSQHTNDTWIMTCRRIWVRKPKFRPEHSFAPTKARKLSDSDKTWLVRARDVLSCRDELLWLNTWYDKSPEIRNPCIKISLQKGARHS